MDLLDLLLPRPPQLAADHPLPQRLPAHLDLVFLAQILCRQRRPESLVHRLRQDRHRLLFDPHLIFRLDGFPRSPWTTALSPRFFNAVSSRLTCRLLIPSSSAACFCVISFFLAFFRATSRSRSACVISSCPSCIPPA